MPRPTAWGWFWLAWALAGLAVELYWLAANSANTLSRQVWGLEGADLAHPFDFSEWTPLHWIIGISLLIAFLWLGLHLAFGVLRTT